jgi:HK97 family phage prohead protease
MSTIAQRISPASRRKIRNTISNQQGASCLQFHGACDFKASDDKKDDRLFFQGFANTANVDRGGDFVQPSAFRAALKSYKANPVLFFQHNWSMPIGQITELTVTDKGLFVKGYVMSAKDEDGFEMRGEWPEFINWIRQLVRSNILRTLSVGFRMIDSKPGKMVDPMTNKERSVRILTKVELLEISLVGLPMNRESTVTPLSYFRKEFGNEVAQSLFGGFQSGLESDDKGDSQSSTDGEVAAEGGLDAEEARQLHLDKALIDGRITRERYDALSKFFADTLGETNLDETEDEDDTAGDSDQEGRYELVNLSERRQPNKRFELVSLTERANNA